MKLSVLTVTHNRSGCLERKLAALEQQTLAHRAFELVVFVNGCTDDTLRLLDDAKMPYALTVLRSETNLGVAAARNACAKAARGDVLYFSDDDCLPARGTLSQHLEAQREACVSVGGLEFVHGAQLERWVPKRASFWSLNGANSSVPAAAFRAVGGFDEMLSGYGGEDVLLGYALFKRGLPFVALPEASAQHLGPNPVRAGNTYKARSAGRNAARIAAKHPELAYRLGVHRVLLTLKTLVLKPKALWRALAPAVYDYEHAYLEGALEERRGRP